VGRKEDQTAGREAEAEVEAEAEWVSRWDRKKEAGNGERDRADEMESWEAGWKE
jgi:hypothetical protein